MLLVNNEDNQLFWVFERCKMAFKFDLLGSGNKSNKLSSVIPDPYP